MSTSMRKREYLRLKNAIVLLRLVWFETLSLFQIIQNIEGEGRGWKKNKKIGVCNMYILLVLVTHS